MADERSVGTVQQHTDIIADGVKGLYAVIGGDLRPVIPGIWLTGAEK